jgi:DNA invertase Pin-like site-specific DNA recombinase
VRQPELSTEGSQTKLLLAIYSYFAETEREFISIRTKQGLAAVRANGVKLGRHKGSKNKKSRRLDPHKEKIAQFLEQKVSIMSISKIINPLLESPLNYNSYLFYINNDPHLYKLKNRINR